MLVADTDQSVDTDIEESQLKRKRGIKSDSISDEET